MPDLYRQALGEQHPKVARGIYYVAMAMKGVGADVEEVTPLLRQGITIMRQTDPNNINLPHMLQQLSVWLITTRQEDGKESRLTEAERLLLEAKTHFTRHYGRDHSATISVNHGLARLAVARGDLALAENIWKETVKRFQQLEEGSYGHISALFHLGEVEMAFGKPREAESLFRQALELGRMKWGTNDERFSRVERYINQVRAKAVK